MSVLNEINKKIELTKLTNNQPFFYMIQIVLLMDERERIVLDVKILFKEFLICQQK